MSEWTVHSHELVKFKLSWQDGIPVCCTGREREILMWTVSWCSSSTGDARSLEVHREILRFTRSSSLLPPTLPPTTITNCRCRVLQTFLISLFPSQTVLPSFAFTAISTAPAAGRCCLTFPQQRQENTVSPPAAHCFDFLNTTLPV